MFQGLTYSLADWVLFSLIPGYAFQIMSRKEDFIHDMMSYLPDAKITTPQECFAWCLHYCQHMSWGPRKMQDWDGLTSRRTDTQWHITCEIFLHRLSFPKKIGDKQNPTLTLAILHILYVKFSQVQERKFQLPFPTLSSTDQSWVSEANITHRCQFSCCHIVEMLDRLHHNL